MKNIIKLLLVVMALVLVVSAFTACEEQTPAGPECEHKNVEFVLGKTHTCTEDGLTSGFRCKDCGTFTVPQLLDPAGHDFVVEIEGKDATCTEDGFTTHFQCNDCTEIQGKEVIPATGHKMTHVDAKAPTCGEDGHTAYDYCANECGLVEGFVKQPATGNHTEVTVPGKAATCTTAGLTDGKACSVCGKTTVAQTEIPAGHKYVDGNCSVCGVSENPDFAGGKGTAEVPYLIKTAEQLSNISKYYGTYHYYKVADGVDTIDMTGVGKIELLGSFDGNGVKLVNLTTALFEKVGYQNEEHEIKISNVEATLNNTDGRAFVRNIYNGGKTTFENVSLHGYIEGLYNMGSFYNYGTANLGGSDGVDYTVEFVNSTSDLTIVCTSGNIAGGFLGHSYEGAGNSFTMIITNSSYTGKIYTTTGKAHLYFTMTSDYNNTNNKFVVDGVEVKFDNGHIPSPANVGKIATVLPTVGENGYEITPVEGAVSFVAYLNAQVSAHNEDGSYVTNLNGMTWPLANLTLEQLAELGLINSAVIVNGEDHDYGYAVENGVLTIYSGRTANYESGVVRLQVNQYDAEGNLLAAGTINLYTIEHPHTFVGGDCTTDAKCGCGAKQTAPGHAWVDVNGKAPTCTAAGYTAHKECEECGATEGKEVDPATGHSYTDGICGVCGATDPKHYFVVTIPEALAAADGKKVQVTGTVVEIYQPYDSYYNNTSVYIADEDNNKILVFRVTGNWGIGDKITVKGEIDIYNSKPQIAQGGTVVSSEKHVCSDFEEATCVDSAYCLVCGALNGEPLGHTTDNGTCERCGKVFGSSAPVEKTITFNFSSLAAKGTKYTDATALTAFNKAAGSSVLTSVKATNIYDGNGSGGAYPNTTGLIKTGTSSATGKLVLDFGTKKVSKVEIKCQSWTSSSGDKLSVNGSSAVAAPNSSASVVTFELNTPSSTVTIDFNKRVFVFEIVVYYTE